MSIKCGCNVGGNPEFEDETEIIFCALHREAEAMLEAMEEVIDRLESQQKIKIKTFIDIKKILTRIKEG